MNEEQMQFGEGCDSDDLDDEMGEVCECVKTSVNEPKSFVNRKDDGMSYRETQTFHQLPCIKR